MVRFFTMMAPTIYLPRRGPRSKRGKWSTGNGQKTPLKRHPIRTPRESPDLPRSLGIALGQHALPRHDQAVGRRHVRRRDAALLPLSIEPFRYYARTAG